MTPLANAVNETLAAKTLKAKFGENLTGVAPVAETANVLVVHPSLDVKSVAELIALAKSRPPGDILAASSGRGTSTHLTTELFNLMAGIKLGSVHYRGGGDITKDLLSGQVKLMFATIAPVLQYVKAGSLRGIATTGPKRDSALPELPTVAESGLPGFDVRLWLAHPRAGRHAAPDHRPAGGRDREGAGGARREDRVRRAGLRSAGRDAGRVHGVLSQRSREMAQGHRGRRPDQRVSTRCSIVNRTDPSARAAVDAQRQCAQDRPVRRQLLVGAHRDGGAGALARDLAGLPQAGADRRRGRHRFPAADRPLEGLRRRQRFPRLDAWKP